MRSLITFALSVATSMMLLNEARAAAASPANKINLTMRRQEYLARLKIETGKQFCGEEGMRRCFAIEAEQCTSFIQSEFSKCLSGVKIPEPVPLTGKDVQIAEAVGACLGGKMGKTFEKKFKNAGDCAVRK